MNRKTIFLLPLAAIFLLWAVTARAADPPEKAIFDSYMKIRAELARDSMRDVPERAAAIASLARGEATKTFPPALVVQAEALARARDLPSARTAFKAVSNSLIAYLASHKAAKGAYYEVYCPMAQASWLQTNKVVSNPYLGKEMATCGEVKE